jgi:hypothetical protein
MVVPGRGMEGRAENLKGTLLGTRGMAIFLFLLIALELWMFSGSFDRFFTRDSLVYITNIAHSWGQLKTFFLAPSQEMSYRPANYALVALLGPLLGLNPHRWHWVPILFHVANTLLFYLIGRRILPGTMAAFAATGFWGLHSVAGWITYDITYLSDFLAAFLFLTTILLAVEGNLRRSRLLITAALIAFILSLMTKEASIMFPLAIWISVVLADLKAEGEAVNGKSVRRAVKKSLRVVSFFVVIDLFFVSLYSYWLLTGHIYAQDPHSAYHINLLANVAGKMKYIFWAFNLPEVLHIPHPARNRALLCGLSAFVLVPWVLDILRRRFRLSGIEWAGLLWFLGLNLPAFMLAQRLAQWYLYVPLLGLALAFGMFVQNLYSYLRTKIRFAAMVPVLLLGALGFSTSLQTRSHVAWSDSAYESRMLASYISAFRETHTTLPLAITVFFLPSFEKGISQFLTSDPIGHGELIELYYPGTKVNVLYASRGNQIPSDYAKRTDLFFVQFLGGVFTDVTEYYQGRHARGGLRIARSLEGAQISVSRDEYYPNYDHFDTPTGAAAFYPTPEKEILTQIGGSTVTLPLHDLKGPVRLCFDVAWMYGDGDGGWAEVVVHAGRKSVPVYRQHFNPNPGATSLAWKEVRIDLQNVEDPGAELVLRCYNDRGKNTAADWLNWRDITIERAK